MVLASSPLSYATEEDKAETKAEIKEEKKTTSSLQQATEELNKMQAALKQAKDLVNQLKGSKKEVKEKVEALQAEIENVNDVLKELENDIEETEEKINEAKKELEIAEGERDRQYADMKKRIRFMYENGGNYYLEMLLSSKGVSGFMNEVQYIESINQYDRQKMDEMIEIVDEINEIKSFLEEEMRQLEEKKAAQEESKAALQELEDERQKELSGIEAELVDAESVAKAYEEEVKAQNEIIAQIRAAEAKKGGGSASKIDDRYGFLWPCPSSTRISSDYGPRTAPTSGASSNHKGIDISAPHGVPIVAVQNGTVAVANYSPSAGNYVMIDHGAGLYSVYMHCSGFACSPGQDVVRGDTIAYVGSTGVSTGNHLHFAVSVDGSYVNPWGYVSQ